MLPFCAKVVKQNLVYFSKKAFFFYGVDFCRVLAVKIDKVVGF